ncbi:Putative S-adenosyl-L-methionine-dependent methyltransferase [Septoria linicola]|uniref:S-adenosyl-L-methionine-dependent methyltransferase n=1 Tax=Septoria linicola TaxID=215465 RepID=A0A9Q9AQX4_9PEZI|nr:putative S-adenosyl-L-methionine-dependent methyltransferase [Septoria linicola]USW50563.1 Putative S-adenosyl-L-methionine-dependent methyltransferase [Septoria linicola]
MEADERTDHDSTFGGERDSLASSHTSLSSAITRYQYENGRRYHAYQAGKYHFPNDEKELERMDIEHHNQKLQLDGRLHLCPLVDDPKEILDLGTGTGIWAMEMADEYPDCQILGTDLSPVQPTWVPPNCRFEIDDFDRDWAFGSERFDMIHHRFLLGHVSNYVSFYKQAYDAIRPGGSIELVEIEWLTYCDDDSVPQDSAMVRWGVLMAEAFAKMGRQAPTAEQYKQWLEDTGFENVHSEIIKRPTNDWPKDPNMKEIGKYCCLNFLEGMEGFTVAPFTRILGWKLEECQVLLAQLRKEWVTRRLHGYHKGIIVHATKPKSPGATPAKAAVEAQTTPVAPSTSVS